MKNPALPLLLLLLSFLCGHGQDSDSLKTKAGCLVCRYMEYSRLGPPGSEEITPGETRHFMELFQRDAFLLWDLYRLPGDTIVPPLSPGEYTRLAQKTYGGKQPVISYPRVRIRMHGKESATAFLTKVNQVIGPGESLLQKNKIKLRVEMDLEGEQGRIGNIFRDTRQPILRSISAEAGWIPWSNVSHALEHDPQVELSPGESYSAVTIRATSGYQAGGMTELRLTRGYREGPVFVTGLRVGRQEITSTVNDYIYTPKVMRAGDGPPADSIFMVSSPEVYEIIRLTRFEFPLLLKSYLASWAWLKAGPVAGFANASSDVQYLLSYYDSTGNTPPVPYNFTVNGFVHRFYISLQLSGGIEKRFRNVVFGLEPVMTFGMNPLQMQNLQGNYRLDDPASFHSILETVETPAFEWTFGFRLYIGILFRQ